MENTNAPTPNPHAANPAVVAVVVTYNRLELLRHNLDCLRAQTHPLAGIVVVNNGSTDGTEQWLDSQTDLTVITQDNCGGAGGFARGLIVALHLPAAWLWCMDDDVFPRPTCLEELLRESARQKADILAPRRLVDGRVYSNDFVSYDLSRPFASLYVGKHVGTRTDVPVEIAGTAFEGPLIRREVVERIGLPNRDLFIFCDDTDYCLRATRAGFRIFYVPAALMDKHHFFSADNWSQRQQKKKWKRYYQIRNSTYLNHHYGRNWAVRHLRGFNAVAGYMVIAAVTAPFSKAWRLTDIGRLWRAYRDGLAERLGIIHD